MSHIPINIGGGGGTGSDECTATLAQVLSGYTAVTSDSNDEAESGTMTNNGAVSIALSAGSSYTIPKGYHSGSGKVTANSLSSQTSGTASASDILSGKTAWVGGSQLTGSMTNNGTVSQTLSAGSSYTIAKGYHSGSGKVTANSLSSQTSGTASASDILSGKTAWVGGSQLTGSMTNNGTVSQTLSAGSSYTIPKGYHSGSGKVTANSVSKVLTAIARSSCSGRDQSSHVHSSTLTIPSDAVNISGYLVGYAFAQTSVSSVSSSYWAKSTIMLYFDDGSSQIIASTDYVNDQLDYLSFNPKDISSYLSAGSSFYLDAGCTTGSNASYSSMYACINAILIVTYCSNN